MFLTEFCCFKVLDKCQLREAVQEKEGGLDSSGKHIYIAHFINSTSPFTTPVLCNTFSCTRWIKLEHGTETIVLSGTRVVEEESNSSVR